MGNQRSIDEIRADLARNRVRVADSVGEAAASANPKRLAKEGADQAKGFVQAEFTAAKQQFVDEQGINIKRVMVIGGAVLGLVVFAVTVRAISGRRDKELERNFRKAIEAGR